MSGGRLERDRCSVDDERDRVEHPPDAGRGAARLGAAIVSFEQPPCVLDERQLGREIMEALVAPNKMNVKFLFAAKVLIHRPS